MAVTFSSGVAGRNTYSVSSSGSRIPAQTYEQKQASETAVEAVSESVSQNINLGYIPQIGDIIDASGELVRTVAIERPSGGYYSEDSPETVALNMLYGVVKPETPKSPSLVQSESAAIAYLEESVPVGVAEEPKGLISNLTGKIGVVIATIVVVLTLITLLVGD